MSTVNQSKEPRRTKDDLDLLTRVLHDTAVKSYIMSRLAFRTGYLMEVGWYNAHHACECMLKSLAAARGHSFYQIHDLNLLLTDLGDVDDRSALQDKRLTKILNEINPQQELARYSAASRPEFDKARKNENGNQVRGGNSFMGIHDTKDIDFAFISLWKLSAHKPDVITQSKENDTTLLWKSTFPLTVKQIVYEQNDMLS